MWPVGQQLWTPLSLWFGHTRKKVMVWCTLDILGQQQQQQLAPSTSPHPSTPANQPAMTTALQDSCCCGSSAHVNEHRSSPMHSPLLPHLHSLAPTLLPPLLHTHTPSHSHHQPSTDLLPPPLSPPSQTADILESVAVFALKARLREQRVVKASVSCDAWSLLSGRVNGAKIYGEGWRSPLNLTAQTLEVRGLCFRVG